MSGIYETPGDVCETKNAELLAEEITKLRALLFEAGRLLREAGLAYPSHPNRINWMLCARKAISAGRS